MKALSHADAFQVLLLQAADEGRGPILFGESLARARQLVPPFLVGKVFPDIYLEHPLCGDPFVDVTVLLNQLEPGTRVDSPAAGEHGAMLDWFAETFKEFGDVSCGFELDTKEEVLPEAAVHFQPRHHVELVRPFCDVIGEPERADLYLGLARRMPDEWQLSFFGLFRGRPGFPLRVCGYLGNDEKMACAGDPSRLAATFDTIGFAAYDDAMLAQISALMATVPGSVDFQFDIFPDGHLGPTFSVDARFGIEQPQAVRQSFECGPAARVMNLLQDWGVADDRWKAASHTAFARAIPVELDDGSTDGFAFTLMPQWVKARWTDTKLQPSKLYHLAGAGLLSTARRRGLPS